MEISITRLSFAEERAVPRAAELDGVLRRGLGLFFERVEDVDGFMEPRHKQNSERPRANDADLANACANGGHRLPVRRHPSELQILDVLADLRPSGLGKRRDIALARREKHRRLRIDRVHDDIHLYITCNGPRADACRGPEATSAATPRRAR